MLTKEDSDELSDKLKKIREIRLAGFKVAHVVHRHGMKEEVAKEVEAALIDAYPGLTNEMGGEGSGEKGVMHADEVVQKYTAEEAVFKHRALLISVNTTSSERPLYEAVRHSWKLNLKKVEQAEVVLAVVKGLIKGAFIPGQWLQATSENFPGYSDAPKRLGFIGHEASEEIQKLYVGRRIPKEFSFGSGNPIRYTW
ncbi:MULTISPECIES: hypothetical protein [Cyanophyceae]|uniref:hypothetical protein n=1 Tax=Cyanophyceae TaxID=3028117 RepID=UPI00016DC3B1|nr:MULTISPECIES: hypothetical protein [Cyanophyceae]ACB01071.1 conserved hypothetical protein [Picosynechococcus sp. PCC 7002]SMH47702.1 hypothetical protein SAMN06272755_1815 [Picosynechococcus sp. OG1]SMQ81069.1 hypothetical protein SAMN06272774_1094 [Synechococcus sp. 7002]